MREKMSQRKSADVELARYVLSAFHASNQTISQLANNK